MVLWDMYVDHMQRFLDDGDPDAEQGSFRFQVRTSEIDEAPAIVDGVPREISRGDVIGDEAFYAWCASEIGEQDHPITVRVVHRRRPWYRRVLSWLWFALRFRMPWSRVRITPVAMRVEYVEVVRDGDDADGQHGG